VTGQGISKAGNTRARAIAVQMAWLWLGCQSKSELSLWYYSRVGDLKGRVRRIMIIALARKLVICSVTIRRDRQGADRRGHHCLIS
jgi:transposase